MHLFTEDSWLARFMNLVGDLAVLHFLWLLTSLPIITIGASTTALYYSAMKRVRRDEGYPSSHFISSFKENFRQATLLWLLMLAIGAILWVDLRIGMAAPGLIGKFMIVSSVVLMVPYILTFIYLFPVQAKFTGGILATLKNALLISIANMGYTILFVLIQGTLLLLLTNSFAIIGLFLCLGFGIVGYINSSLFVSVFRKYVPDEFESDLESTGMDRIEF